MQEVAQLSQFDEELYKVCENVHSCGNMLMKPKLHVVRGAKPSLLHVKRLNWLLAVQTFSM